MEKEDFELFLLYVSKSRDIQLLKVDGHLDDKIKNYFVVDEKWLKEHHDIPWFKNYSGFATSVLFDLNTTLIDLEKFEYDVYFFGKSYTEVVDKFLSYLVKVNSEINRKLEEVMKIKNSFRELINRKENINKIKELTKTNFDFGNQTELISFFKEIRNSSENFEENENGLEDEIPDLEEMRKITESKETINYEKVKSKIKSTINEQIKRFASCGDWRTNIFYYEFSYPIQDLPNLDEIVDEVLEEYKAKGFVCQRVDHERKDFRKIMLHWSKDKDFKMW